ncbi:sideroflexin [Acrasis kona]|uniref:Sideroflexin n=1 Tax=Acrasis kona TaxID=1008807 RepID=A0AAW2ZB44_9EUKA
MGEEERKTQPTLSLFNTSQYDMNTFSGRLKHFASIADPRLLLVSRSEAHWANTVIQHAKDHKDVSAADFWRAQNIKSTYVNHDTGQPISALASFPTFLPANTVLLTYLLTTRSIPSIISSQVLYHAYNTTFHMSNKSDRYYVTDKQLQDHFFSNCLTSVTTAVALTLWANRTKIIKDEITRQRVRSVVPFISLVGANIYSTFALQRDELNNGIDITDEEGNLIGKSKAAGSKSIRECILERTLMIGPVALVPHIVVDYFENKRNLFVSKPHFKIPIFLSSLVLCMFVYIPVCYSLLSPQGRISVSSVEEEFRKEARTGDEYFYYEKHL